MMVSGVGGAGGLSGGMVGARWVGVGGHRSVEQNMRRCRSTRSRNVLWVRGFSIMEEGSLGRLPAAPVPAVRQFGSGEKALSIYYMGQFGLIMSMKSGRFVNSGLHFPEEGSTEL